MRLAIVHNEKDIYAEFKTDDFRKALIDEFAVTNDVGRAFDRVCSLLKNISGEV